MKVLKIFIIIIILAIFTIVVIVLFKKLGFYKYQLLGPKIIEANLGENFNLFEGQEAQIRDENLRIKAIEAYFHPCPKNVQCFWSGLRGTIEISKDGTTKTVFLGAEEFGYRVTGNPISNYELTIRVSKVSQNDSGL